MHDYCLRILLHLRRNGESSLAEIERDRDVGLNRDEILWTLETLKKDAAVDFDRNISQYFMMTEEGSSYTKKFPEEVLITGIKEGKVIYAKDIGNKVGLIWAKKNGWISINDGILKLTEKGENSISSEDYPLRNILNKISEGIFRNDSENQGYMDILKRRNLIIVKDRTIFGDISITDEGIRLISNNDNERTIKEIDREMILNKNWIGKKFQKYEIDAASEIFYPARLHPMHEFINEVRKIWISMGFVEKNGPVVNSAFWNFDVLFTPQDHPARDMHDTFFLSNPKFVDINDEEVLSKVRKMHKDGWNMELDEDISGHALLKTHNTVLSAHYIKKFGNLPEDRYPFKAFFLGRVFRNESLDYKHLAEFYQSDSIVIGDNLALSNLIYELKKFFDRILHDKSSKIMIRPSYFPFTEPSLEVFYFNKDHDDYVEIGGAGMIREEITHALGTNKRVIAWGLGLDRLLLDRIGLKDISELYRNKIRFLRDRDNL